MIRKLLVSAALLAASGVTNATILLSEDFDDVATLAGAGWTQTNNSSPPGVTGWFQGDPAIFDEAGSPDTFIAANYLNTDIGGGSISNWLLSPVLSLSNRTFLTFQTRSSGFFADRLEVRLSTNGASGDVGSTSASVGDFGDLYFTLNPALDPLGYPTEWTSYTLQFSGVVGDVFGRFAFRYNPPSDNIANGDYIGIDSVRVTIPEPSTLALFALAVFAFGGIGRRRS